ncbi:hypothetical protein KBZ18_15360, partial [Synechococcus sp. Cruz-9H2]|uniref:hypothetical protein n=1 Tax=unclassified Synechococcus TaxID=2626047 RepID=UPI0020CC85C3
NQKAGEKPLNERRALPEPNRTLRRGFLASDAFKTPVDQSFLSGATVSKTYIWKGQVAVNSFTPQQYNNLIFKEPTTGPWLEKVGLPFPEAPKPTPKDIFISLSNQGGYVAKWSLIYILLGKAAPVFEGGTLALGMDKEVFIQPNAVGIVFAVDALGKIGDPNIFRQVIPSNSRNCFVLTGTIFNPAKSLKADSDC